MSATVRLVRAEPGHVRALAPKIRAIDRLECEAMGRTVEQALAHGLAAGARTWSALIDDAPHAMFGVVVVSAACGEAVPWFLGSDEVPRYGRMLLETGPRIVTAMHGHGCRLSNFVSADNRQAIRLLERWGFTVEPEPVVVRDVAFRRFIREIVKCAPPSSR